MRNPNRNRHNSSRAQGAARENNLTINSVGVGYNEHRYNRTFAIAFKQALLNNNLSVAYHHGTLLPPRGQRVMGPPERTAARANNWGGHVLRLCL
jgi:SLT domain-containing protein